MVKVDHPFLPHFNLVLHNNFFHVTLIDAFVYLIMFIINKAWHLGPILQKLIILKVAQNSKN
jgi:hypothetical protein